MPFPGQQVLHRDDGSHLVADLHLYVVEWQTIVMRIARQRNVGRVTVCDPVPDGHGYGTARGGTGQYDVTYEYGGRTHTTRTNYHPGDRIRVRVIAE